MLLEDYTELSGCVDAPAAGEKIASRKEMDLDGFFTWAMIGEVLDSLDKEQQEEAAAHGSQAPAPKEETTAPKTDGVSSVDALLYIANCAQTCLAQGKTNEPAVIEMTADMLRDTAKKIAQDSSLRVSAKEKKLMVLWLQRHARKLAHPADGIHPKPELWSAIRYKAKQFHDMLG